MKIHEVLQGSDAWKALRIGARTASEASIMMGASPYQTRAELLRQKATGIEREVDDYTQRLRDAGHAAEAAGRKIAEEIIGDDLFPATASSDDGYLLASFDGITMFGDVVWETKLWNEGKAADVQEGRVPKADLWQVVQQLVVSGADKALYMVTDGTPEKTVHCWYSLHPSDQETLLAGWRQFDEDLANYKHVEVLPPPTVAPIENLPALVVQIVGEVRATNVAEWQGVVKARIDAIKEDLRTDEDFAVAKKTCTFLEDGEKKLVAAKDAALKQTSSIDELFGVIDGLRESMRAKRLSLEKLVKAKEISIRAEIADEGKAAIAAHIQALNKRLGVVMMPAVPANIEAVMKSKRTIQSLRDAVAGEVARFKLEANAIADRITINLTAYGEAAAGYEFLFRDLTTLAQQPAEAFAAIVANRIRDHKDAEAKRLANERERIRIEEEAKATAKAKAEADAAERKRQQDEREKAEADRRQREEDQRAKRQESAVDQIADELGLPIGSVQITAGSVAPAVASQAPAADSADKVALIPPKGYFMSQSAAGPKNTGITGTAKLRDLIDDELEKMSADQLQQSLDAIRSIRARAAA